MAKVIARAYRSPTLILLALDWPDGESRQDFLGFEVRRTPGFLDFNTGNVAASSFLPNRVSFTGPPPDGQPDFPSNVAPIQKFMWWDARLDGSQAGDELTYEITPVCGAPGALQRIAADTTALTVSLPAHVDFGIGTWFNRAVMSSQAFSRKLQSFNVPPGQLTQAQALDLRQWLANGMEAPVPDFVGPNAPAFDSVVGAIYHLTDKEWIIPALQAAMAGKSVGLVFDADDPAVSADAQNTLTEVTFFPRTRLQIMHNKFLVAGDQLEDAQQAEPKRLTCGSANYTTQGLTSQANLVHTFDSPALARLYYDRFELLKTNPTKADTTENVGWSNTVSVGDAGVRVFFSPEKGSPGSPSASIETIVASIHAARSSVIFCLFTPTDQQLRDACFSVGDSGKMMFGLVNRISRTEPTVTPTPAGNIPADQLAALELFHRSRDNKDAIGAEFFSAALTPAGFETEINIFPGDNPPPFPPVIVHHKFIVIDAETDSPVIYTGSANMSGNSVFNNDENLLEIKGSPRLAQIYLAEFLRLYEHYRARARFIKFKLSNQPAGQVGFSLRPDRSWADKHYTVGSPEFKARLRMLSVG
ncbi:MAG TPA: phospholipase D-like domain-containing protein [Vicinamibacterales bacterium]|nr:phospholipase D-like domain-containing protein [Vicinamibacterales bacterium]